MLVKRCLPRAQQARYIATGRGFATSRISFSILYSRFSGPSIYMGLRNVLLLTYITMTLWCVFALLLSGLLHPLTIFLPSRIPHMIYFWISILALCLAPFIYNPHQFSVGDFFVDYRETLRWFSRGNSRTHANSWHGYCRLSRTRITGFKKKKLGHPSEKLSADAPRASWRTILLAEVFLPLCTAICFVVCYMFTKSFSTPPVNGLLRIIIISLGPIVFNAVVLITLFFVSLIAGPMLSGCCGRFPSIIAGIAHMLALIGLVGFFEFLWRRSPFRPLGHSAQLKLLCFQSSRLGTFRTPSLV